MPGVEKLLPNQRGNIGTEPPQIPWGLVSYLTSHLRSPTLSPAGATLPLSVAFFTLDLPL